MSSTPNPSRPRSLRTDRFLMDTRHSHHRSLLRRMDTEGVFTIRHLVGMVGILFIVLLPNLYGHRILPYRLAQVLRHPVHSRVNFSWKNAEEAARQEKVVRERFSRYYLEDSQWVYRVFDPVYNLLNEAYVLATDNALTQEKAVERLGAYALKEKISVEPGECKVIFDELRSRGRRIDFYEDLIKPARGKILKSNSFSSGILSSSDYKRELEKTITVISAYWEKTSLPVGTPDGPISIQQVPHLLQVYVDAELGQFRSEFRKTYTAILARQITPSLSYDASRTESELSSEIANRIRQMEQIPKGALLIEAGRPITRLDLDRLRTEEAIRERALGGFSLVLRLVGMTSLLLIASVGFLLYIHRFETRVFQRSHHLGLIMTLGAVILMLLQLGLNSVEWHLTLVPLGVVAGVAAIAFGPRIGVVVASLFSFAGIITTEVDVGEVISLLGSSWIFCCMVPFVRRRSGFLRAGVVSGAVSFLGISFWAMAGDIPLAIAGGEGDGWSVQEWSGVSSFLFWVGGSMVLTAALPWLERFLGATTNVTLLELSDQEHPCLRRLVIDAPGTYHHSFVVGNLAEAAAEAIGGNSLLARVASYYHDIGKIMKPEYFTENDRGNSPHDQLSPSLSTLIITSHVKDGVEMAMAYGIPRSIIDIIEQHHGDTAVQFFYDKACQSAQESTPPPLAAFSYPGPRPQTREAAIVSLADSVEAASRTLKEPTPAHIERMVHRLVIDKVMMGQCDDSRLTFRDISTIERSFVRTLNAMHHSRIRYPEHSLRGGRRG